MYYMGVNCIIGYQLYETNDYLRYGARKWLVDPNIENENSTVLAEIDSWDYEGGLYSPYDALFFTGISAVMTDEHAMFTGQREATKVFFGTGVIPRIRNS